jgi:hypothetical protein
MVEKPQRVLTSVKEQAKVAFEDLHIIQRLTFRKELLQQVDAL